MILLASWHGLSATEVVGFTKDADRDGWLTIRRVKSHRVTVQRLVRHADPLLDERNALIDFVEKAAPGQPVFNITRSQFWQLMREYGQAAGLPRQKTTPVR